VADELKAFSLLTTTRVRKSKIVTAEEALQVIQDGDTIGCGGFGGSGFPEEIAIQLERYYLRQGRPRDLTIFAALGPGDAGDRGLNRFAHEGLLRRVFSGHWGFIPKLQRLALENRIIAYNLPFGVMSTMYRDIAAAKPRTITKVGLGTFVDPRHGGGRINGITTEDVVEVIEFDGSEYLAYKTLPIHIAIIRGTTADPNGNITMEKEALTLDTLALATAAKNSGGLVIAQVERIAEYRTLNARQVKIPGILVDCVVVSRPENHWQTFGEPYNPAYSSEIRVPLRSIQPMALDERKVIARRAAFELRPNSVINLGIGMPEGVANVANEEKIIDYVTMTAEPGVIGGVPAGGLSFGAAVNTDAVIDITSQFDFYDGGGLDTAFLGLAQADGDGNLNVSKFGPKLAGAGGFINISQNAKKVVFLGTFTASGLEIRVENGKLEIVREGTVRKFVRAVEQLTFCGRVAQQKRQPVFFVTERCVFRLTAAGMELIEIAPGIELETHILPLMDFEPIVSATLREMDERIFRPETMGLLGQMMEIPVAERLSYDPRSNIFFVNFEGHRIQSEADVLEIAAVGENILSRIGKRVYAVINYDDCYISPEVLNSYISLSRRHRDLYYARVTRYASDAFARVKMGAAFREKDASLIFHEGKTQAEAALKQ